MLLLCTYIHNIASSFKGRFVLKAIVDDNIFQFICYKYSLSNWALYIILVGCVWRYLIALAIMVLTPYLLVWVIGNNIWIVNLSLEFVKEASGISLLLPRSLIAYTMRFFTKYIKRFSLFSILISTNYMYFQNWLKMWMSLFLIVPLRSNPFGSIFF